MTPHPRLAELSLSWLHPEMAFARTCINDAATMADEHGPETHTRVQGWGRFLTLNVVKWAPGVYSFPYLCPDLCRTLAEHMLALGHEPNENEEPVAQINECVLSERDPDLALKMAGLWVTVIPAMARLILQMEVGAPLCIQGALYTPDGTSSTQWHHDTDSECSVVVALTDPSAFEGGGTDVWRDFQLFEVPPLPVGHALMFAGRSTQHKGNLVTQGTRQLLVHWANQSISNEYLH